MPTIALACVISQRTVSEAGQALVNLLGPESVGIIFCGLVATKTGGFPQIQDSADFGCGRVPRSGTGVALMG